MCVCVCVRAHTQRSAFVMANKINDVHLAALITCQLRKAVSTESTCTKQHHEHELVRTHALNLNIQKPKDEYKTRIIFGTSNVRNKLSLDT